MSLLPRSSQLTSSPSSLAYLQGGPLLAALFSDYTSIPDLLNCMMTVTLPAHFVAAVVESFTNLTAIRDKLWITKSWWNIFQLKPWVLELNIALNPDSASYRWYDRDTALLVQNPHISKIRYECHQISCRRHAGQQKLQNVIMCMQ